MNSLSRRQFLASAAAGITASCTATSLGGYTLADPPKATEKSADDAAKGAANKPATIIAPRTADDLQRALDKQLAAGGGLVRLKPKSTITCTVQNVPIAGETSIHALLVPANVDLDLNGGTVLLDLRSNSYGVRLASHATIRNGTVRVVRSEGKGSQAIWHAPIGVGAAYGDGGTVAKPGHFSSVGHWRIEDMTLEQPFEAAFIQLMSEAHHGLIRNIRMLDSEKALLGISLDWGTVGPVATADHLVPQMRKLWEKNEISSTHPQHVLIENITVGKLGRSMDGNDAGVRCSGCHHITIRNLQVETAMAAVALFGGDFGFEFAPDHERSQAHKGYLIDGVKIGAARMYGIVMNGAEDNVYRSRRDFGYDSLRDPVHPGLDQPVIRNVVLRGTGAPHSRGVYAAATTGAMFENVDVEGFDTGVAVNSWVRSLTFRNGRIAKNKEKIHLNGGPDAPIDVKFENNAES